MARSRRRKRPAREREFLAYLEQKRENSLNRTDEELSERRTTLLDYYMGEDFGDEQEGFSQQVTRECFEVAEWALAGLMRIFYGQAPICEFPPKGEEDEAAAQQESDVVSHLVMNRNPGYQILRAWFKDALIYPVAYLKVWWEEALDPIVTEYKGQSAEEVALLAASRDPDDELLEFTPYPDGTADLVVRKPRSKHQLRIRPVPPEEVLVDSLATTLDLDEADFVCHDAQPTRSELISRGYPKDLVWDLPETRRHEYSSEREARRDTTDEDQSQHHEDGAQVRVEVYECYLRYDFDGDGVSEYRKVVYGGDVMLENEPFDYQPFIALSAHPQTHRHVGVSLVEPAQAIQRTQSVLLRQMLDNLYRVNNPRTFYEPGVDTDALLDYAPAGAVACEGPSGVDGVKPETIPQYIRDILPVIQHLDDELAGRTGVSKQLTALDPDVLAKTTVGAYMTSMGQASQRLEMLAREFAECGVKKLCLKVHHLMRKHADAYRDVAEKIRGQWVPVNPGHWLERADMDVRVGLGTGNVAERVSSAMMLLEVQKEAVAIGLANPKRLYATLADLTEALGKTATNRYFVPPESYEFRQWQQSQAEQAQAQQAGQMQIIEIQAELEEKRLILEQLKLRQKQAIDEAKLDKDYAAMELEHAVDIAGVGVSGGDVLPMPGLSRRQPDAAD